MLQTHKSASTPSTRMASWEDDGGSVRLNPDPEDLNSLLAKEQTAIMSAESATTLATHELHRDEALRVRGLVELTAFPGRPPHQFQRDQTIYGDYDVAFEELKRRVDANERLLALEFSEGRVSGRSYEHRSRVIRQDRIRTSITQDGVSSANLS